MPILVIVMHASARCAQNSFNWWEAQPCFPNN